MLIKKMRIENFPKLKQSDHSPKRDEVIDVSSDPPYFSLDSPFNVKKWVSEGGGGGIAGWRGVWIRKN
jgi:hypothetical protein